MDGKPLLSQPGSSATPMSSKHTAFTIVLTLSSETQLSPMLCTLGDSVVPVSPGKDSASSPFQGHPLCLEVWAPNPDVVPSTLLARTSHCISRALMTPAPSHTQPCAVSKPSHMSYSPVRPKGYSGIFPGAHNIPAFDTYPISVAAEGSGKSSPAQLHLQVATQPRPRQGQVLLWRCLMAQCLLRTCSLASSGFSICLP